MRDPYFHEQVLGIKSPWRVDDVRVDKQAKTVETHVVHEGQAQCPRCQADSPRYDHRERRFRHLDLYEYRAFVLVRVPRIDALQAAVKSRRPNIGTLFHSDRGSQYASLDFRAVLIANGITASMSGKGECWDNAVVESFFGSMKRELGDPVWESRAAARATIFEYIETWYNRRRRHSTLGYLSPEEYESRLPIAA